MSVYRWRQPTTYGEVWKRKHCPGHVRVNPHSPAVMLDKQRGNSQASTDHARQSSCPICRDKKLGGRARKGKEASARKNQELAIMTMNLRGKKWEVDKIEQLMVPGAEDRKIGREWDGLGVYHVKM